MSEGSTRYKIIANPASRTGAAARRIPSIQKKLTALGLDFDLVYTTHPGHALELAYKAVLENFDTIVAAGGDGTANEVLNGILAANENGGPAAALGLLPIGRGNDWAESLRIPPDFIEACQVLADNNRQKMDIGRVYGGIYPDGRYFGNCVGVGFDAVGTIEAAKLPRLGGFLSYFAAVLKTIFLYHKGPVVEVVFNDQQIIQPSLLVSVMNGRRIGGGFIMAPEAVLDDGWLNLCIAEQVSRRRIFALIPHFLRGTQGTQPEIKTGIGKQVYIRAVEGVLPAQTDGEILCIDGDTLQIELLPKMLEIVCPTL